MSRILLLVTLAIPSQVNGQIDRNRRWPAYVSGVAFQKALKRPIASRWKNSPLRDVLLQLAENSKVFILLDRRIDPTQLLDFSLDAPTFKQGMKKLADHIGAEASFSDGVVYLGPRESALKLRTLIHLRVRKLQAFRGAAANARKKLLLKRRRFDWKDLDSPDEILERLSKKYSVKIEGHEQLPHDLWFGAALPSASFVDVLSLVLIQFDRTFRWSADFTSVEIVPRPQKVFIEKTYRTRKMTPQQYADYLKETFHESNVVVRGRSVLVKATLETHEAIALVQNPRRNHSSRNSKKKLSELPLDRLSFSKLNFRAVAARNLLKALKNQGILFEYDEKQLIAAGVDLDVKITFMRDKISAVDFVKEICQKIGVDYEIFGRTVKLKPERGNKGVRNRF